jgi:hypothetical protein
MTSLLGVNGPGGIGWMSLECVAVDGGKCDRLEHTSPTCKQGKPKMSGTCGKISDRLHIFKKRLKDISPWTLHYPPGG